MHPLIANNRNMFEISYFRPDSNPLPCLSTPEQVQQRMSHYFAGYGCQ